MGVSANLVVNAKHGTGNIIKLVKGFGYKVETEFKEDHAFLRFQDENEHHYQMYVARSQEYGGLDATILSFGSRPESIALLKRIAAVLGGFLQESDSGDGWVGYQDPHVNNAQFCLQHVILERGLTSDDELADKLKDVIDYK